MDAELENVELIQWNFHSQERIELSLRLRRDPLLFQPQGHNLPADPPPQPLEGLEITELEQVVEDDELSSLFLTSSSDRSSLT